MNLNKLFLKYCKKNILEVNPSQLNLIETLNFFYNSNFNKSLFKKIFSKKNLKPGFYLQGDVGVGKTMILDFFYENLKIKKQRLHFAYKRPETQPFSKKFFKKIRNGKRN